MAEDVDINKMHSELNAAVQEHTRQAADMLDGLYSNAQNAFVMYRQATTEKSTNAYYNLILTKRQLDEEFDRWLDEENRLQKAKIRLADLMRKEEKRV